MHAFTFREYVNVTPLQEGKALFHFMHEGPLFRILLFLSAPLISQKRKLIKTGVQNTTEQNKKSLTIRKLDPNSKNN